MYKRLREVLDSTAQVAVAPGRSRAMSRIRSSSSLELIFRMALVRSGITGWCTSGVDEVPGRPDFYFPKLPLTVFIDGCFWHACPRCGHVPRTRTAFWKEKFRLNQKRDKRVARDLARRGIQMLRVWEHEVRDPTLLESLLTNIRKRIHGFREHR